MLQIGPIGPPASEAQGDGSSKPPQQLLAAAPGAAAPPSAAVPPPSASSLPPGAVPVAPPPPEPVRVTPLSLCSSSADIVVGQKVRPLSLARITGSGLDG